MGGLPDDALPGFGLRIRDGGKRTWIVQYRVGTKQRRLTIGTTRTLDADQARREAKALLAKVQLGGDPRHERNETRAAAAVTLATTTESYLSRYASTRLKPSSLRDVTRYLQHHWKPLASMPLRSIVRADVALQLSKIAISSGPFAANRARAAISSLYSWAIAEGIADVNPVVGTRKAIDEEARDRVLTDGELALIWRHAGEGDFGQILQLLILTGQRREEVAAMRWSEIDLEGATWHIGADRTKNSRSHNVPLSIPALDLLHARHRPPERELVFGTKGPFSGWSKAKNALDQRMRQTTRDTGLASWRLHDIRRTVATQLANLGVLPHVVEAILNHVSGHKAGVAGIYNRSTYAVEKSAALAMWGQHILALSKTPVKT